MRQSIVAIIPARMSSSRFPGKPLVPIRGLSMIEHVRRRVLLCKAFDEVVVATCDEEIIQEVEQHGGNAIMTSPHHLGCIDRIAEAAMKLDAEIIVNVQGDIPLVHPESLELLIEPLRQHPDLRYVDMIGPLDDVSEITNRNVVKVVADQSGNALYYSREPIPSSAKVARENPIPYRKQFGINAFKKASLLEFGRLAPTPLEMIESVDMLRLLEHGIEVKTVFSPHPAAGVDVPEDLKLAESQMHQDSLFEIYQSLVR